MTAGLRSSIAIKLALLVMGGSVAVFSLVLAYSYTSSRQIILDQAKDNALNLALSMSRRIEQDFRAVAKLPMSLAGVLENSDLDEKTKAQIERGRRLTELTKQPQYEPMLVEEQVVLFLAGTTGLLDIVPLEKIEEAKDGIK